ncbi:MAG: hypothetical protein HZA89_03890 [Verrucomicrobia bacterium]|nr:hypothetical protein [Verrucomicrobiota bacterium]
MSNFDASNPDAEHVQCAVCEKAIKGGQWFARISHGQWLVALCCPLCTEVFEAKPAAYIRRIETLSLLRSPEGPFKQD